MSIQVTLLTFNKRENSTLKPTTAQISGGSTLDCLLLDNTSLMNPTFKLNVGGNPVGFNYCYVPSFERYFFINDWSYDKGFWYASCTCDVLASWKTEIGAGSHYILRSASAYDEYISDGIYGCKVKRIATNLPSSGPLWWGTNHSYVVGIVGYAPDHTQQVGSVTYYQFDDTMLLNFVYYLMHDLGTYCDIQTAPYTDPGVQEALINPIQYIVSCIALPVGFPASYTQATDINFGYYNWTVQGSGSVRIIKLGETVEETGTITITKHPQASSRGKYLNGAPFTSYTFHLGPFGDIPIDPADYIDADNLRYKVLYDMCQGMGRLAIGPAVTGNTNISNLSYCGTAKVGADVQLAQALTNPLTAQLSWETGLNRTYTTGTGSASLSANVGANLLNAQSAFAETYVDAIKNMFPTCCGKGSPGSFLSFKDDSFGCYLIAKFMTVVDENLTELGRPLCQTRQLNTLSGYVLCSGADAIIPGTAEEVKKVNEYLNTGFFWE